MKYLWIAAVALLLTGCKVTVGDGQIDEDTGGGGTTPPPVTYTLTLNANPVTGGTVSGAGTYQGNAQVAIQATAASGYNFSHWSEGGATVTTSSSTTIVMTGNRVLTAHFQTVESPTPTPEPEPEPEPSTDIQAIQFIPPAGTVFISADHAPAGVLFAATRELAVGDGNAGIWRSTDGGENWTKVFVSDPSFFYPGYETGFIATASGDPTLVIAGGTDSYAISTDGGATWETGVIHDLIFGGPISFSDGASITADSGIFLASNSAASALRAGLFRSRDGGTTWEHVLTEATAGGIANALLGHVAMSPADPSVVYAATWTDDDIHKSVNGGDSFVSIKTGIGVGGFPFVLGIHVDPGNADHVMINDNLSVNGGSNWSIGTGISPSTARWIDGVLVGFSMGMLRASMDNGQTWVDLAELKGNAGLSISVPLIIGVSADTLVIVGGGQYYRVSLDDITSRLP